MPVLYRGPFSRQVLEAHTSGNTTLGADRIREGVVIVPQHERLGPLIGRVALKSISPQYLLRKDGTEFH